MRKPLISFAIVSAGLFLLGAGCAGTPASPSVNATTSELENQGLVDSPVVSIGPNGFNPASITIKKGEAVMWINEDVGAPHWPASNPHPAHADYPGFAPGAAIAPGGSWQFEFDKVGTWGYHDHLNPTKFTGTVVVTE